MKENTYIVHSINNGSHCQIPWPVNSFPIVSRAPRSAVDVNNVRHVAHGIGLDQVCHEWLVKHAKSWRWSFRLHQKKKAHTFASDFRNTDENLRYIDLSLSIS